MTRICKMRLFELQRKPISASWGSCRRMRNGSTIRRVSARAEAPLIEDHCDKLYEAGNWGLSENSWFKRAEGEQAVHGLSRNGGGAPMIDRFRTDCRYHSGMDAPFPPLPQDLLAAAHRLLARAPRFRPSRAVRPSAL